MSFTRHKHWYFLIDCNQFFVSCEQAFNPKLMKAPTVVLSNNDGCVVSRSQEAKNIGIPMGAPLFQILDLVKRHNVNTLSSNFELYGDMSLRVMQTLSLFSPDIEEYSIDEAFLKITEDDPIILAKQIKNTVHKHTGIPVSVGIGQTKTLAKVASDIAKKEKDGVFLLSGDADIELKKIPVIDIWGVGKNIAAGLKSYQIYTAFDLKNADDSYIRQKFSVVLLRTALELRGIECLSFDEIPKSKKSITCSKSFGRPVTEIKELDEALSSYTSRATGRLRKDGSVAKVVHVFLTTSRFKEDFYYNYQILTLPFPSDYTPDIIRCAKNALRKIFIEGYSYKKVGITLLDISPKHTPQSDFFDNVDKDTGKKNKVMMVIDSIKDKMGKNSIYFASEGIQKDWEAKKELCSPKYTTRWDELLKIKI
ncbi:MAG: Y-family DNA polymerase [Chlamydiae bacterium]|nr:Y-family DNA polymerase [Chlamydiota bacterium]